MTNSETSTNADGCPPDRQTAYSREELLACSRGELFHPDSAKLPTPDMLMTDRITLINNNGGKGFARSAAASISIRPISLTARFAASWEMPRHTLI